MSIKIFGYEIINIERHILLGLALGSVIKVMRWICTAIGLNMSFYKTWAIIIPIIIALFIEIIQYNNSYDKKSYLKKKWPDIISDIILTAGTSIMVTL